MDDKPHILVISQYFYPESFRINDIAAEWVARGYKVTVLTGIPNYPMGKFFKGYGIFRKRREYWRQMDIIRIPLIPRGKSNIGMVMNYISFVISGWLWKSLTNIKTDLVFSFEVSPMTQVLIGCWYAKKKRVPHFLYVQDLWPENVEIVAGVKNPIVIRNLEKMVRYIYSNTDRVFVTSDSFKKNIQKRGVEEQKLIFWPQYAEEFYKPIKGGGRSSFFRVIFTGNIGTAQGLDILPVVATKLQKTNDNVIFIIVGDGRYQEHLEADIEARGVSRYFKMIPRQPAESIPKLMADSDAAFLSFSATKLWEMTIPAKLQSYMACGMPIIAAADGETRRIINEAGCGICVDIGDADAVVDAIKKMKNDETLVEKMRKNSVSYCDEHFNKKILMDEMDKHIAESTCIT